MDRGAGGPQSMGPVKSRTQLERLSTAVILEGTSERSEGEKKKGIFKEQHGERIDRKEVKREFRPCRVGPLIVE